MSIIILEFGWWVINDEEIKVMFVWLVICL